jgi:hypothetical protein
MNANELANELLDMDSYEFAFNEVRAAVLTLLTQQAEIEALRKAEPTDDVAKYHYNKGHEDGRKLAIPNPVKALTDEEYAGIGLHLFRIGEATSIKDGIRLAKLIVELTNIKKASEK